MKSFAQTALALVLVASAAACGSQSQDTNAAANNDSEVASTNTSEQQSNPFAESESKMSQAMMAAAGSDVGDNWAKKMIAHHQGAIDMSEAVLREDPKQDVAEMARMTIEKNRKDISDIQKLTKDGSPDQKSAELYRPSMMDMKQKMDSASGSDINELFMRKMLEHHKGAVAMSDVALQNGVSGAMQSQVQKTRSENDKDAKMTEAMLRGEPMKQSMAKSPTTGDDAAHDMNSM